MRPLDREPREKATTGRTIPDVSEQQETTGEVEKAISVWDMDNSPKWVADNPPIDNINNKGSTTESNNPLDYQWGDEALAKAIANQPTVLHVIGTATIPDSGDSNIIEISVANALKTWNEATGNTVYKDSGSVKYANSNITIKWDGSEKHQPRDGSRSNDLAKGTIGRYVDKGQYSSYIVVKLGTNDCRSNYQHFNHQTLQYIIAHEIGHYLGLIGHTNERNHLMSSGVVDYGTVTSELYDTKGFGIPQLAMPEIKTIAGDKVNAELEKLKKSSGLLSDKNTCKQIEDLELTLKCVG